MGEMLNFVKTLCLKRLLHLTLALLGVLAASLLGLAQSAQGEDLSADEIIEILQQNPDVLAEAKAEIVAQLRDRGYPVTDRSITDDRLFSEIRSDDRARHVMSEELKKRGFGAEPESPQPASGQQPAPQNQAPAPVTGQPAPGSQPSNAAAAPATAAKPRA